MFIQNSSILRDQYSLRMATTIQPLNQIKKNIYVSDKKHTYSVFTTRIDAEIYQNKRCY